MKPSLYYVDSVGMYTNIGLYLTYQCSLLLTLLLDCGMPKVNPFEGRNGRISKGHDAPSGTAPWHVIIKETRHVRHVFFITNDYSFQFAIDLTKDTWL